jgi:carbon-monoxide dehydrogenase medium subunit
VAEAVQILARTDGAKALAGGHSLIPSMNLRLAQPSALVDIGRLDELKKIWWDRGSNVHIGALCTHAQIASSKDVQGWRALVQATSLVGDPQVRNWGTIGGNLANADPASDPPTVVLAFDGIIHTQGPSGSRSIQAADFFIDLFTVDLQPGELITEVELPGTPGSTAGTTKKSAYAKMAHPASRYAVVGVCVVLDIAGGTCRSASVAIGGAVPKATKSPSAEAALTGSNLDAAALEAAAQGLMNDIASDVMGDIFAPEDYRRAMAGVYLKRAVRASLA